MDWNLITQELAESLLLSQAKKYAVAQGYPESVVFRCTCELVEKEGVKTFSCALGTLGGVEEMSIICDKSKKSCTLNTSYGNMAISFQELDKLKES